MTIAVLAFSLLFLFTHFICLPNHRGKFFVCVNLLGNKPDSDSDSKMKQAVLVTRVPRGASHRKRSEVSDLGFKVFPLIRR